MTIIINMLLRYTFCIISIITLLILGLMFFYFNNQIVYQNTKLNAMIDIVSGLVQKDAEPITIPQPYIPGQSVTSFPQMNIIDVSDSENDDDDDDEDDDEEDDDEDVDEDVDNVDTGFCGGIHFSEISVDNSCEIKDIVSELVDSEKSTEFISSDAIETDVSDKERNVTIEVTLDTSVAEPKHEYSIHKTLHVNDIRDIAIQMNLLSVSDAKKMKKNDLIELINSHTEHKSDK